MLLLLLLLLSQSISSPSWRVPRGSRRRGKLPLSHNRLRATHVGPAPTMRISCEGKARACARVTAVLISMAGRRGLWCWQMPCMHPRQSWVVELAATPPDASFPSPSPSFAASLPLPLYSLGAGGDEHHSRLVFGPSWRSRVCTVVGMEEQWRGKCSLGRTIEGVCVGLSGCLSLS